MTLYIGVDIHARQQTLSYLDTSDGTNGQVVLDHEGDDVKEFYRQFQGEVIIGIEACGYTNWYEVLVEELGHKLLVGDAAEIRRLARWRQKNDRRDADLLLELLVHNEFPALYRYSKESTHRHIRESSVRARTRLPFARSRFGESLILP